MKIKFKKIGATIAFWAVLSSFLPAAAMAASFSDVAENSALYSSIEYLKSKEVVKGYADGTFQPNSSINRAEALKIILTGAKVDLASEQKITFKDVKSTAWEFIYVRKAYELKIISGYADNTFRSDRQISLSESLKVILNAFQVKDLAAPTSNPYADVDKAAWDAPFAQYAKDKKLYQIGDDGKLHGDKPMTRGDFAEIVYRLMYIQENKLNEFPISLNWPVFTHATDHFKIKYPFDWVKITAGAQMIFWRQDKVNGQLSFSRIFPNSATIITVVDANEEKLDLESYVAKLKYDNSAEVKKETINGYAVSSMRLSSNGLADYYVMLPNQRVLIIYTQVGGGLMRQQLEETITAMVNSIAYFEGMTQTEKEDFLTKLRNELLVKGKGKAMLSQIDDAVIIETDTIGVGTGAVDYYFSDSYNVTIKYERSSDTMLAIKQGKTSAF